MGDGDRPLDQPDLNGREDIQHNLEEEDGDRGEFRREIHRALQGDKEPEPREYKDKTLLQLPNRRFPDDLPVCGVYLGLGLQLQPSQLQTE